MENLLRFLSSCTDSTSIETFAFPRFREFRRTVESQIEQFHETRRIRGIARPRASLPIDGPHTVGSDSPPPRRVSASRTGIAEQTPQPYEGLQNLELGNAPSARCSYSQKACKYRENKTRDVPPYSNARAGPTRYHLGEPRTPR